MKKRIYRTSATKITENSPKSIEQRIQEHTNKLIEDSSLTRKLAIAELRIKTQSRLLMNYKE